MRTSRAIHTEIGVAEHQGAARAVQTNCIRGPRAAAPLLAQTTESLRTIPSRSLRSSRLTGAQTNSQCVGLTTRARAIDTVDASRRPIGSRPLSTAPVPHARRRPATLGCADTHARKACTVSGFDSTTLLSASGSSHEWRSQSAGGCVVSHGFHKPRTALARLRGCVSQFWRTCRCVASYSL